MAGEIRRTGSEDQCLPSVAIGDYVPVQRRPYTEPNCPRCHEHSLDARGLCVRCDAEQLMAIMAAELEIRAADRGRRCDDHLSPDCTDDGQFDAWDGAQVISLCLACRRVFDNRASNAEPRLVNVEGGVRFEQQVRR